MESINKTAVVIPCSKSKRAGPLPAKLKYTGRIYPYILKLQKQYNFDLYIYSAKYGIISEYDIIDDYNVTFKGLNIEDKKDKVIKLDTINKIDILSKKYNEVILSLGKDYSQGLNSYKNVVLINRIKQHSRKGNILAPATALYDYLNEKNK